MMLYRHAGPVLVRATTDPGRLELPDGIDLINTHGWLARLWCRDEVRTALRIASPALCRQVDVALAGGQTDERQLRRIVTSVATYLLRWQGRPTPFGLFAGVATASAGDEPVARFGLDHRVVLRADAEWLSTLIDDLEQNPDLLARLPVVVNNTGFVRGDRFIVPVPSSYAAPDRYREIAVARTRPVRAALAAAAAPVRFGELGTRVADAFPEAPQNRIGALLTELVTNRVLLTSLRAPMTTTDALAHLSEQLEDVGAEDLPDLADLLKELTAIHDELAGDGHTPCSIETVAERMTKVGGTDDVLAVDVQLDCQASIPNAVIREAEAAATTLLRLTPNPFGSPAWKDFHVRFRDRYGPGALVPVRDVVADGGLGFPAGFLGAPRGQAAPSLTERDARLLALIQQAGLDGEINFTPAVISDLAVGDHLEMVPPPRVELAFQIRTASAAALARGQFHLWVTGAPRPASSMAGRFAHLLPETDQERLAATFTSASNTVVAQLSFPPRRMRNENITRTPGLLPHTISLSEHHAGGIDLDDLAITADATRLYLVRTSTGEQVQPYVLHALEAAVHTPPLARFLAEVATARCGEYGPIDFGAGSCLPYLPRIRAGRSVLSPARWLLTTKDLSQPDWDDSLGRWRDRWHVPSTVLLCQADLRLPLDLDYRLHRALLCSRLERAGRVELREDAKTGWPDRPCEFLVSLTAVASGQSRPAVTANPAEPLLPGCAPFVHVHLLGHPARFDEVLTDHLPRLLAEVADHVRASWFRRDHDTTRPDSDHHLVLYLRLLTPEDYGPTSGLLARWFGQLSALGLLADLYLAPYRPQHGRYGERAMRVAEQVFAADSTAALAELAMAARSGLPTDAIAAVSLADLAACFATTPDDGWRQLAELLPHEQGKLDRSLRIATLALANRSVVCGHSGGEQVAATWDERRVALANYRDELAQERNPATVLRSLLHDHYVRVIGVDPDRERVVNRLARTVALRQLAGAS